jgi:two-component system sensor histidine kinase AlgZ
LGRYHHNAGRIMLYNPAKRPTTAVHASSGRLLPIGVVIAAWFFIALAWTPPTYLLRQTTVGSLSWGRVFLFVSAGFLPWMTITPLILWLGQRFPVTEGGGLRHLAIQAGAGAVLLPLITFGGILVTRISMPAMGSPFTFAVVRTTIITTCYGVPTYIAVAGIAQALVYFRRYRARERLLAHAELRALQAQLNPHFLFNTLNAISAIGYRDPEQADRALTHLSQLLRATLEQGEDEVALYEEIAFARDFLELYSIIMPGHVRATWDLEAGVGEVAVPRMLLQPLIENALVHGLSKLAQGGELAFTARQQGDHLLLVISNDSPEIPVPAPGAGVGLANVQERLRVVHGDKAELCFDRGATRASVVITLPRREISR